MDSTRFISELNHNLYPALEGSTFDILWEEYRRVILRSLITSFGLDFFIKDKHGGDVDTVNNVRNIGKDPGLTYKNKENEKKYSLREPYDTAAYHADSRYRDIVRKAKKEFNETGKKIKDTYVENSDLFPGRNAAKRDQKRAELDHTISAHEIHDDPGRILADIDGLDLANDPSNLSFTNSHLNRNKSDMSAQEYIDWCEKNPDKVNWNGIKGDPLPEDVKKRLLAEEKRAREAIDHKINMAYYTKPAFYCDAAKAAVKQGAKMGLREGMGVIFLEIWASVEEEVENLPSKCSFSDILSAMEAGVKKGFDRCKREYKEILAAMGEGATAGSISSIITTVCNIFATTSKNAARTIRQICISSTQAGKVLLFNPDNLLFGERIKKTSVILATGASVVIGSAVGDHFKKPITTPGDEVDGVVSVFVSTLVSGLLSCSFLLFLDRSKWMNDLFDMLNRIATDAYNYREIANLMEEYAAKLSEIDFEKFRKESERYEEIAERIENSVDEDELNRVLSRAYEEIGIKIPWEGDFDTFMNNQENHLVFS